VLLIVAATLVRNGLSVAATDLGVRTAGVTSINQRGDDPRLAARAATVLARDPRIALVAMTSQNPLFGQIEKLPVQEAGPVIPVSRQFVTPDYGPRRPAKAPASPSSAPLPRRRSGPARILSATRCVSNSTLPRLPRRSATRIDGHSQAATPRRRHYSRS
jgi:hypothetical protein